MPAQDFYGGKAEITVAQLPQYSIAVVAKILGKYGPGLGAGGAGEGEPGEGGEEAAGSRFHVHLQVPASVYTHIVRLVHRLHQGCQEVKENLTVLQNSVGSAHKNLFNYFYALAPA